MTNQKPVVRPAQDQAAVLEELAHLAIWITGILLLIIFIMALVEETPIPFILPFFGTLIGGILVRTAMKFGRLVLILLDDIEVHTRQSAAATQFTADEYRKSLNSGGPPSQE
jgi:hypothetical protein